MSCKVPVDVFASNPLGVIFGPAARAGGDELSVLDIVMGRAALFFAVPIAVRWLPGRVAV